MEKLRDYAEYYREAREVARAEECEIRAKEFQGKIEKLRSAFEEKYLPISLAEEGIFVDPKPFALSGNVVDRKQSKSDFFSSSSIEQRLLRQENGLQRFFDENGHMICLADPRRASFTKMDKEIQQAMFSIDMKVCL